MTTNFFDYFFLYSSLSNTFEEMPIMYYRNHSQGASTFGFRFYVEVKSTFIRIAPSTRMLAWRFSLQRKTVKSHERTLESARVWKSRGTVRQTSFRHTRTRKVCEIVESESQYSQRTHGDSNTRIFIKWNTFDKRNKVPIDFLSFTTHFHECASFCNH